jgi:hypothetical protein
MHSPPGEGSAADAAASSDRRALLSFILTDVWQRLSLPEGTKTCDDLDLDAVSVPHLLVQLRTGARPDLRECGRGAGNGGGGVASNTTSSSSLQSPGPRSDSDVSITAPSSAARKPPVNGVKAEAEEETQLCTPASTSQLPQLRTSTPHGGAAASAGYVAAAVVSLDSLLLKTPSPALKSQTSFPTRSLALIQPIPGTPNSNSPPSKNNNNNGDDDDFTNNPFAPAPPAAAAAASPPPEVVDQTGIAAPIPDLILPEIRGGGGALNAPDAVAQCAYELFAGCVGSADDDLLDTVRIALEIPPSMVGLRLHSLPGQIGYTESIPAVISCTVCVF